MTQDASLSGALLSTAAAAAMLGVSDRQLRELIRAGNIPFVNVGLSERPAYRLRPADLEAFILQRTAICRIRPVAAALRISASDKTL